MGFGRGCCCGWAGAWAAGGWMRAAWGWGFETEQPDCVLTMRPNQMLKYMRGDFTGAE